MRLNRKTKRRIREMWGRVKNVMRKAAAAAQECAAAAVEAAAATRQLTDVWRDSWTGEPLPAEVIHEVLDHLKGRAS